MVGPPGWLPSKCDQSKRSLDRRFHPSLGYRTTGRLRAHSLPARRWPAADVHRQIRRPVGDPPDAILLVSDALTRLNRRRVYEFADEHRLPATYERANYVPEGGLSSCSPDLD